MTGKLTLEPGDILISEGKRDPRLFILESGTLEVKKGGVVVTELDTPMSIVGEICVVLDQVRTCSVIARTDCELTLVGNDINEIIEQSPRMTKLIMQELAERLEKTTASLANAQDNLFTGTAVG